MNQKDIQNWVHYGADKNLLNEIEQEAIKMTKGDNETKSEKDVLSSSQVRNIYGEITQIKAGGYEKNRTRFIMLKAKVAYAVGRNNKNNALQQFKRLFDWAYDAVLENYNIDEEKNKFMNFCDFMEAFIAFHKANGGK